MSIVEVESHTLLSNTQHANSTYKCYLRLPNMKSVVYNVAMGETVEGLKEIAKRVFGLNPLQNNKEIKLIVNEVQLQEGMDLSVELFDNAIVHVIVSIKRLHKIAQEQQQAQEGQQQTLTLRIKQPSVKCPILTLPQIPLRLTIKSLKSRILQFYRRQYFDQEISKLDENELYLVYGGRILMNDKLLEDYDVAEDGVVYVVNGRQYVREVTREEAERRINQIKGRVKESSVKQESSYQIEEVSNEIQETNKQTQGKSNQQILLEQNHQYQQQQQQQQQSQPQIIPQSQIELKQQSDVLNIIQSIVHDQDSQVEGDAANDLNRSQKFLQRYDSKTGNIIEDNDDDSKENDEFLVTKKSNSFNIIDAPVQQQSQLYSQQKDSIDNYLTFHNNQLTDYTCTRQLQHNSLESPQLEQTSHQGQSHEEQHTMIQKQQEQLIQQAHAEQSIQQAQAEKQYTQQEEATVNQPIIVDESNNNQQFI